MDKVAYKSAVQWAVDLATHRKVSVVIATLPKLVNPCSIYKVAYKAKMKELGVKYL